MSSLTEATNLLSELWFDDAWTAYRRGNSPYKTHTDGSVHYTAEAQEFYNHIEDQVEGILIGYFAEEKSDV
jgi:hypothetical protein